MNNQRKIDRLNELRDEFARLQDRQIKIFDKAAAIAGEEEGGGYVDDFLNGTSFVKDAAELLKLCRQ